ncbi:hypothetical protein [uncultured Lamprocystis sp.]|jgi:hypothetical protein|uniref:hypothetical protein n=1 Tax=uncultured Lamprocystis sp. TaxID=543132 RepID=UPI0025D47618|nr:hypothetical protein [uncultured Lamprocystis sp.]
MSEPPAVYTTDRTPDYARACLVRWGAWLRHGGGIVQGYAHATTEGQLRRDGTLIHGSGRAQRLDDDPLAEQVDQIVARLRLDDRRWPLLLAVYFGGGPDVTYGVVAQVLTRKFGEPVSEATVRQWMREAIATVRGELRGLAAAGAMEAPR